MTRDEVEQKLRKFEPVMQPADGVDDASRDAGHTGMKPSVLYAWLRKWQRILRLQDWDIKIELRRGFDMGENKAGTVSWVLSKKTALIKDILDPLDYDPGSRWPQDPGIHRRSRADPSALRAGR